MALYEFRLLDASGKITATMECNPPDANTWLDFATGAGELRGGYPGPNPKTNGWRISLEFDPARATVADLPCMLVGKHAALSETWLHR